MLSRRTVRIVALNFDNSFLVETMDAWRSVSTADDFNLAYTNGCLRARYTQICVGARVQSVFNSFDRYTLAGIQPDGRAVLSDRFNSLIFNFDPLSLDIVR
jgi:hypothetical protein